MTESVNINFGKVIYHKNLRNEANTLLHAYIKCPDILKPVTWFAFQMLLVIQIMFHVWNQTNKSVTNFL